MEFDITKTTNAKMTQSIENNIKDILGYKERINEKKKEIITEIKNQGVSDFTMVLVENQLNYIFLPDWEKEYLKSRIN